jgi:PAS domain S-box-containing protein
MNPSGATGYSVRQRVLLPMLLLGAVTMSAALYGNYQLTRSMVADQLRIRASMLASMALHSARSSSQPGELQQIVNSLGAESDVLDIVLVSGTPATVVATTHSPWLGKRLDELPVKNVREDLEAALFQRKSDHQFDLADHMFDYTMPMPPDPEAVLGASSGYGAVMVHLDTRPLNRSMQGAALGFSLLVVGVFTLLALAGYWLVMQRVVKPITGLTRAVAQHRKNQPAEWPGHGDDEIGELETTLRDSIRNVDAALLRLRDQKFALDQHCIVSITDTKGRITYSNDRFAAISGYSREELLGKDHRIVNSGLHPKSFMKQMWDTLKAGQVWHGEVQNRAKDGSLYWVATTIVPTLGADGKPEQYISIRTDITQQKNNEAALAAARDAAEVAVRAKSEFLATMSHEIRTPMNGVLGFADLLLQTTLDEEQEEFTLTIRNSGVALLAIIDDILDLSKLEADRLVVEREAFDPQQTIAEVRGLLAPRARDHQVELRVEHVEPERVDLMADSNRFRQVVLNLVGNAIKFSKQGTVIVRTRLSDERGGMLRVEVIDNGIGISAEAIPRLFTKFSQADATTTRRYGGTGLGLAISKELIELMGGQIGVESELGKGSTFWFTLPTAAERRASSTLPRFGPAGEATTTRYDALNLRVLVAEDTLINQLLVTRVLENLGCTTSLVTNGREALALLDQKPFDVVLMDCHMPEMDGFEACTEIRAREAAKGPAHKQIPVIALTASVLQEDREHCLAVGMNEVISKPFRPADLKAMLQRFAA